MSYSALNQMRIFNEQRFGKDVGPFEPDRFFDPSANDLKSAALRFIHDRCDDLKFDFEIEKKENETNAFEGTSTKKNQIPYNMQMDINRLCFERELEHFIDSGTAEDAYNVYYCFFEIFLRHYGKSKKLTELLSEFESNGSSLLMKHRDHYSHSVYVFALGLAIYDTNEKFRQAFDHFYQIKDENESAKIFLEYWGLTALFHDIGYPFELPFEQVMAYYEVSKQNRSKEAPLIAYKDVSVLIKISDEEKENLKTIYNRDFKTTTALFAFDICQKLGKIYGISEEKILDCLNTKPTNPEDYSYYMDHAWFSANRLFQELTHAQKEDGQTRSEINAKHVDALTAIILHNSLYKFTVSGFYKKSPIKMRMEWHPLAYLLMLCDELQCWDRTAYGRNSRKELHPMDAAFCFDNNEIAVTYFFDIRETEKITAFEAEYAEWEKGKIKEKPSLKAYSGMWEKSAEFLEDIQHIVDKDQIPLTVKTDLKDVDRKPKHTYLSASSFLHLYDFAVALHNRYMEDISSIADPTDMMETEFESLSLEYQLSNINQAKYFSRLLNEIDCFYTDRPVDFEMVEYFSPKQIATIAPLEHRRWIHEHRNMGWTADDLYEKVSIPGCSDKDLREQTRMHKLAMNGFPKDHEIETHYYNLPPKEQGKDIKPFNTMLKLIKLYDGLRIYLFK